MVDFDRKVGIPILVMHRCPSNAIAICKLIIGYIVSYVKAKDTTICIYIYIFIHGLWDFVTGAKVLNDACHLLRVVIWKQRMSECPFGFVWWYTSSLKQWFWVSQDKPFPTKNYCKTQGSNANKDSSQMILISRIWELPDMVLWGETYLMIGKSFNYTPFPYHSHFTTPNPEPLSIGHLFIWPMNKSLVVKLCGALRWSRSNNQCNGK